MTLHELIELDNLRQLGIIYIEDGMLYNTLNNFTYDGHTLLKLYDTPEKINKAINEIKNDIVLNLKSIPYDEDYMYDSEYSNGTLVDEEDDY